MNGAIERSCHRLVERNNDRILIIDQVGIERSFTDIALPRYYICYKPRGVVCSRKRNDGIDREDSVLISDWLVNVFRKEDASSATPYASSIKTVGRLDEESEGLLLLSNDGSFIRLLCDPEFSLEKTYRIVVRGSCYGRMIAELTYAAKAQYANEETSEQIKGRILEMIERGNPVPTATNKNRAQPHFPFESCIVHDVGKLPTQHSSDDSYYALVDIVLREGKRHAVRRIIKNAGMRVCYLSRISVEGLDSQSYYDVVKPDSIAEAEERGFLPGGRHRTVVQEGKLMFRHEHDDEYSCILHPGHVMELTDLNVDRIFALRKDVVT